MTLAGTILRLIAAYLRLPREDEQARERWVREVREAFPYGRVVLTAPLGEIARQKGGMVRAGD